MAAKDKRIFSVEIETSEFGVFKRLNNDLYTFGAYFLYVENERHIQMQ